MPSKTASRAQCFATLEGSENTWVPQAPQGRGGHVWQPLSFRNSTLWTVEYNFCNDSCKSRCCSWLYAASNIEAFGVTKSFPPWPEGVQCPLEEDWLADSRSYMDSFSSPSSSHWDAVYQVPRAGPDHANPELPVSQQDLCHKDQIILLAHTLWTVWQHKRKESPAFISAPWVQLPTCAPQGTWAQGCLVHEPYQEQVWDTLNTALPSWKHIKLPSVPLAAIMHSFKNIQLLSSISYSGAKIL